MTRLNLPDTLRERANTFLPEEGLVLLNAPKNDSDATFWITVPHWVCVLVVSGPARGREHGSGFTDMKHASAGWVRWNCRKLSFSQIRTPREVEDRGGSQRETA